MHYRLFDEEGELFETSVGEEPAEFVHGNDEIPTGLEEALVGKESGAKVRVELDDEDAFGPYMPEGLISLPRTELPDDVEQGDLVPVVLTDDDGDEVEDGDMEFRVVEIRDDEVVLDANHPLAGQRVTFEVEVIGVDAAS
jgi:FKBP-type peptidyl-prolyl cis-trans isomerase SlyD